MCGINGIVNFFETPSKDRVNKMCTLMPHRGPDFLGIHAEGPFVLGHRRLSIIDLSEMGNQPMVDKNLGISIAFNGEIYNYQELREKLRASGYSFTTNTDTEVLIKGFVHWGIEKLCKNLTGMFAFALWSEKDQALFLARDRFGEKPLYYVQEGNNFIFSSVATIISRTSDRLIDLNPLGILSFLKLGYCLSPFHVFEGLQSLPPAHYAKIDKTGIKRNEYWRLETSIKEIETKDLTQNIERLLYDSIQNQLISDVPLGCLLSGGVDSALVASIAAEFNPNMRLFTVKMPGSDLDESALAMKIAKKTGGVHSVVDAAPMEQDDFYRFMGMFSEPLGDASALGVWMVAREAKKQVTVVLTGDGGDELFAGYKTIDLHLGLQGIRPFTANPVSRGISSLYDSVMERAMDLEGLRKVSTYLRLLSQTHRNFHISKSLVPMGYHNLAGEILKRKQNEEIVKGHLSYIWKMGEGNSSLDAQMLFDIRTDLPFDYLAKVDTATMAHSLEARAPFLNHHLAEKAFNFNIENRRLGNTSKGILKAVLQKRLGNELHKEITSEKRGFVLPIDTWFQTNWKEMTEDLINSPLVKSGYLNKSVVANILKKSNANPERFSRIKYSMLALDAWYRNQI
jgi:asparagine synthase (glutamine-hydrolysing)